MLALLLSLQPPTQGRAQSRSAVTGQGRALGTGLLGVAAWCFPQLGPAVLWSASGLTFTSWTWLLPGAQVYKQKANRANKNIISLVFESAAPDVLGWEWGGGAAKLVGA